MLQKNLFSSRVVPTFLMSEGKRQSHGAVPRLRLDGHVRPASWNREQRSQLIKHKGFVVSTSKNVMYLRVPVHIWCGFLGQHTEEESHHSETKYKIIFQDSVSGIAMWQKRRIPSHKCWCLLRVSGETPRCLRNLRSWPASGHSPAPLQLSSGLRPERKRQIFSPIMYKSCQTVDD